jgi:diacylglycerol kinase family enzyme
MDGEYYGYKSQLDISILSKKMRVAVPYNME